MRLLLKHATRYQPAQIVLHWGIACLVVIQYLTGGSIERTHMAVMTGEQPDPLDLLLHQVHNRTGMLILLLMLGRLALRLFRGVPPVEDSVTWRMRAAYLMHWCFYAIIIGQGALGLTASYLYWPAAKIHAVGAKLLAVMILLHVLAAVWHAFARNQPPVVRTLRPTAIH